MGVISILNVLGKRLKELRISKNMTQQQIGDLTNVTKVSICCYEKGTRVPSLETLLDLADIFKVDVDYLVGNDLHVIAENDESYGLNISKEELIVIRELRKNLNLYNNLIDNPKRTIELINKKLK